MLYFHSVNRFILISLAVLGFSIPSANAALVEVTTFTTVGNENVGGGLVQPVDNDSCSGSGPCSSDSVHPNGATANATASGDIVTGELKTFLSATHDDAGIIGSGTGQATASITETFSVSGTGTATALFNLESSWDFITNASFQTQALIRKDNSTVFPGGNFQNNLSSNTGSLVGSLDHLMIVEFAVNNGVDFDLEFLWIATLLGGEGFLDFSNTGTFLIQTSAGVTLTPSDSNYLSNPAFGATVVPVPAAVWLFGTALIGLIGFAKRKARIAA